MLGAIIGDIVGSRFTRNPVQSMDFDLFSKENHYTDNTVLTLGVANGLLEVLKTCGEEPSLDDLEVIVTKNLRELTSRYPFAGYSLPFQQWLKDDNYEPYENSNNTAAKRVSPVAYFAEEEFQVTELSEVIATITHENKEAIEGADIIAHLIYLARKGFTKANMYDYVREVYPPMSENLISYRQENYFCHLTRKTVPLAIYAFMISESFEDTLKSAIFLGGDTATITSMAGALAGAYYGIPTEMIEKVWSYLPEEFVLIIKEWNKEYATREILHSYHVITKYVMLFQEVLNPLGFNYEKTGLTSSLDSLVRSFTNEMIEFMNARNLLPKFRKWTLTENQLDISEKEQIVFEIYKDIRINRFTKGHLKEKIKDGSLFEQLRKLKEFSPSSNPIRSFTYEYGSFFDGMSKYVYEITTQGSATFSRFMMDEKLEEVVIEEKEVAKIVHAIEELHLED